ncbi:hypothetical protein MMPV_005855 [Pyropia vietnamensis]
MEETFATDAGRDLFFAAMDASTAARLVRTPSSAMDDGSERYVAAERLKFYESVDATEALLDCIASAAPGGTDAAAAAAAAAAEEGELAEVSLNDRVARRKCVETLGRYVQGHAAERVAAALRGCLFDPDGYTVEVAVWSLGQLLSRRAAGTGGAPWDALDESTVEATLTDVAALLTTRTDDVSLRVVIKTLDALRHTPALDAIRPLTDHPDGATASAAAAAVASLTGDAAGMAPVVSLLASPSLNVRRAALEDITAARYVPALAAVAVAPNALVLRSRAVRRLLDAALDAAGGDVAAVWDADTEALVDALIWDDPARLDLLGRVNETRRSRDIGRNVKRLFKNDAADAYLAGRTLAEVAAESPAAATAAGDAVAAALDAQPYFDYFGAYHAYKALGWTRHTASTAMLVEAATTLPPRFFNHAAGAAVAVACIGDRSAVPALAGIAATTRVWELKYAVLLAVERLGGTQRCAPPLLRTMTG